MSLCFYFLLSFSLFECKSFSIFLLVSMFFKISICMFLCSSMYFWLCLYSSLFGLLLLFNYVCFLLFSLYFICYSLNLIISSTRRMLSIKWQLIVMSCAEGSRFKSRSPQKKIVNEMKLFGRNNDLKSVEKKHKKDWN